MRSQNGELCGQYLAHRFYGRPLIFLWKIDVCEIPPRSYRNRSEKNQCDIAPPVTCSSASTIISFKHDRMGVEVGRLSSGPLSSFECEKAAELTFLAGEHRFQPQNPHGLSSAKLMTRTQEATS